jgi:hypothetical protein
VENAPVGVSVTGILVGRGVWVGKTIQDIEVGSTLSKVGSGVRVTRGSGRCCLASWVKAVLKII